MIKVALIIGVDAGLGPKVTEKLCEKFIGKVYITSKNKNEGRIAAYKLIKAGYRAQYHQLDITSVESIIALRTHIQDADEGIDLLINITSDNDAYSGSKMEQIRHSLNENFYGNLNTGRLIFPLLHSSSRVVVVTTAEGILSAIPSGDIRRRLGRDLTEDELVNVVQDYERAGGQGTEISEGWSHDPSVVGKVALTVLTLIQQRELRDADISIACVNPGRALDSGLKTIMFVALEAYDVSGKFFWSDCKEVNWKLYVETHL